MIRGGGRMVQEDADEAPDVKHYVQSVPMNRDQHDEHGQLQESDLLDQLADAPLEIRAPSYADHVMLVSLGSYCGPKLTFQKVGRGAETLPFDWSRTRIEGLLHFLRNDFDGFFDFVTRKPVPGTTSMIMYRDWYHSFWHDDPTDEGMIERYKRRIIRFGKIDASKEPVLFVRVMNSSDEFEKIPELSNEIISRFGSRACLLAIMNFQKLVNGAATVEGQSNLLFYFLEGKVHEDLGGAPYATAVLCGLDWACHKEIDAIPFPSMEELAAAADITHWGYDGLGGHRAFEEEPLGEEFTKDKAKANTHSPGQNQIPIESDLLEQGNVVDQACQGQHQQGPNDGITLVSLGAYCGPKLTFQQMGRGAETLPFDWLRTSHEAVVRFLNEDFKGFYDYTTKLPVPGHPMTMYRGDEHSFWHDNPASKATREKYDRRIKRLFGLAEKAPGPILFVRTIATTEELLKIDEMVKALKGKFGDKACLLLIVDWQHKTNGAHVVEDYEDLLVYFLESKAHEGEHAAGPYQTPVKCAIDWIKGEELECSSVHSLEDLHKLADESHWGFMGLGNLRAYETLESPDVLRARAEAARLEAEARGPVLVSLGSEVCVRLSIEKVGAECGQTLPFDFCRTRMEGVVHFLCSNFSGYFDFDTEEKVGDADLMMRRSFFHSFWSKEDPRDDVQRALHEKSFERFWSLRAAGRPLLFVRSVADTEELARVIELRDILASRFGPQTCLLIIIDFQQEKKTISMQDQPYILLMLQTGEAHSTEEGEAGAPHAEAIRQGVAWIAGEPMQVAVVDDMAGLYSVVNPHSVGLTGLSNLRAFEDVPPAAWQDSLGSCEEPERAVEPPCASACAAEVKDEDTAAAAAAATRNVEDERGEEMAAAVTKDAPEAKPDLPQDETSSSSQNRKGCCVS